MHPWHQERVEHQLPFSAGGVCLLGTPGHRNLGLLPTAEHLYRHSGGGCFLRLYVRGCTPGTATTAGTTSATSGTATAVRRYHLS